MPTADHSAPLNITLLLHRWGEGDSSAGDALFPLIYGELKRLAQRRLAQETGDPELQGTALVNEAFLRLSSQRSVEWRNRGQFLALASRMMRQILVDHARQRGGARADLIAINDALDRLARIDPLQAQIVELRYFGGLTAEATAEAMSLPVATVTREWTMARAWLRRELASSRLLQ